MSSFPAPITPALAGAFGIVDRQVLGAAAASISFTGIATANRLFRLTVYIIKDAANGAAIVRLNNDAGANYDNQRINLNGGGVTSDRTVNQTSLFTGDTDIDGTGRRTFSMSIGKQQAADEAFLVTEVATIEPTPQLESHLVGSLWANTAALISRLDVIATAGNFAADTVGLLEGNSTT